MKILFLTVSDQQKNPLHKYLDLHCNFDFKAWEEGFRSICSNVHIFDYYASFVTTGPISMENSIRVLVQKYKIQLLIVPNLYYEISPTFLCELRKIGCRSLIVFFDDSMRFENTNRFYLNSFDFYLTHDSVDGNALYKHFGIDPEFFPLLPSHSFYKKISKNNDKRSLKYTRDVLFVGAKIADRDLFINYLKDNGVDIAVYGKSWKTGILPTEEMIAAYNSSKISLSFIKTADGSGRIQLKARLFEIIMAGGFILSEYCDELNDYFDIGSEIDTFRSPDELLDKIKFYLTNSDLREKMASLAKDKVEKIFSFESVWGKFLEDIKDGRIQSQYPNIGYEVSSAALKSFQQWNFSIIYGRVMLREYILAYQQYIFCQRELKFIISEFSVINNFCTFSLTLLRKIVSNYLFLKLIIYKIVYLYSHFISLYLNKRIKSKISLSITKFKYSDMMHMEAILQNGAINTYNFIEKRRVPGKIYEYFYSTSSYKPTLYSSAYACMTISLLGKLNTMTEVKKKKWIDYFDSFQREDGLFYDPVVINEIYADTDWWGARHLALHMISAYTVLGGKPRYPFRFLEQYYDQNHISIWLNSFEWHLSIGSTNDIDNKIMNIGCLLQYQRDAWGDSGAGNAVRYLQQYLRERINPETGMWGRWNVNDQHQRSRMVQFAYHLFPIFFFDKLKLEHSDLIVDLVLKTQNNYGGFGVQANSSACEDIDSIDILCRLAPDVPERKEEIDATLHRALKWVLCNQVKDGGFVFRLYEPFTYGHSEMMSKADEGSMFATWFRQLSIVYLSRYFSTCKSFQINSCPGYEY